LAPVTKFITRFQIQVTDIRFFAPITDAGAKIFQKSSTTQWIGGGKISCRINKQTWLLKTFGLLMWGWRIIGCAYVVFRYSLKGLLTYWLLLSRPDLNLSGSNACSCKNFVIITQLSFEKQG